MAENEHDENLIDDIMRGGPNYCLDRIESLETEVSRLQARVAELEAMWVEERAARLWADDIFRYEGHLTWSEVDATNLLPEDHDALLTLAKERGVTKAEAMRDLVSWALAHIKAEEAENGRES